MRYLKQISTGKLLMSQGGGDPAVPAHLQTMIDDIVANEGIAANDLEAGYMDDAQWDIDIKTQDDADRDWSENRRINYASIADQLDMLYWDEVDTTTVWKDHIAAVKAAHPKP